MMEVKGVIRYRRFPGAVGGDGEENGEGGGKVNKEKNIEVGGRKGAGGKGGEKGEGKANGTGGGKSPPKKKQKQNKSNKRKRR